MKLQTDPTVIYGMGAKFNGNIRRSDLTEDTPYNTYVHRGLPPTPIALPGRAAIYAALHPADGLSYFLSQGVMVVTNLPIRTQSICLMCVNTS